jgi:hypothetical protein
MALAKRPEFEAVEEEEVAPPKGPASPATQQAPAGASAAMAPPPGRPGSLGNGAPMGVSGAGAGGSMAMDQDQPSPQEAANAPGAAPVGPPPNLEGIQAVMTGVPPRPTKGADTIGRPPANTTAGRIFRPAGARIREEILAREGAEFEAQRQHWKTIGLSDDEIRELEMASARRAATGGSATPFQAVGLEVPDGQGGWRQVQGTFNRTTGQYEDAAGTPLTNARPRQTTGSTSLGAAREAAARELGFANAVEAGNAGQMGAVNRRAAELSAESAGMATAARGEAGARVPLSTAQRSAFTRTLQQDWRTVNAPLREMDRNYQIMQIALSRFKDDPVGSVEAIRVPFERMIDPNSVVRENEYARQAYGLSLLNRLEGVYQKYFQGGGDIPYDVLAGMVETGRQFMEGLQAWNAAEAQRIQDTAQEFGISPTLIMGVEAGPAAPGAPASPASPAARPPSSPGSATPSDPLGIR